MPETSWLASTRWMPCERPRRATSSSSRWPPPVTASLLGEQDLELVDHRDDPRPAPVRVGGAQLLELGHLVRLGGLGPAAHLLGEELQQRQPELAVGVDVDADQPRVRQPGRVAAAGRELGERHALLEVEQVELQLVRGVAGGERADQA